MSVRLHQDVLRVDRIRLRRWYSTPEDYAEMSRCFDFMITRIVENPEEGVPCKRPPLLGWRRVKFHSKHRPPKGVRADMRIVFRQQDGDIQVLCVGKRMVGHPDDVYQEAHQRDQESW